jgi:hypothetical protein
MDFSPQSAVDYIAGQLSDFQTKGTTLYAQLHALTILHVNYVKAGWDTSEIDGMISDTNDSISKWQTIVSMLQPVLSVFGYSGLGFIVETTVLVAYGALFISAAALMYAFYQAYRGDINAANIQRLAAYIPNISSADQSAINDAVSSGGFFSFLGSGISSIGSYLLWGGLIYFGIMAVKK